MINLTAREHFIVHWILTKIYPNNKKIICAFNAFAWRKNNKSTCKKDFTSRQYEYAEKKLSKFLSNDSNWAEECRERAINTRWINNGVINKHIKYYLLEEYLNNGWKLGRTKHNRKSPNNKTREKMSIGRSGILHNTNTKNKISQTLKQKQRKWMNNGNIEKMISKEYEQEYLDKNWIYGRINIYKFKNNKYKEN